MRLMLGAVGMALAACPQEARAEWLEASSAHFVIYADDSVSDVRRFSEQLERYHAAMASTTSGNHPAPSPSNRVTVYVVRDGSAVRRLHRGKDNKFVGGFYKARAGGALAVVSSITPSNGLPDFSMTMLLHEYAHHFLISRSAYAMPRWWSEGAAEFFSSVKFESDGGMSMGRPAVHRAPELFNARDVRAADLLDPTAYDRRANRSFDAFYGKSWLLFHYLIFDESRRGQFDAYGAAIGRGKSAREAATEAFGDFDKLEKDLDRYLKRGMSGLIFKASDLNVGKIAIRPLSAGEAAMMPLRVQSKVGVTREEAEALVLKVREVAARFPQDAAVLATLAEAEFDAGNYRDAVAAADRALAIDAGQVNAYVQKGYAQFRMAPDAEDPNVAFARARATFVALNRRENDHPVPLLYFYRTYKQQGLTPPDLAVDGLIRALEVAPFDLELRMSLAQELIERGRAAEAKGVLQPAAYNPHGGGAASVARRMIERLDRDPGWKGQGMATLIANENGGESAE